MSRISSSNFISRLRSFNTPLNLPIPSPPTTATPPSPTNHISPTQSDRPMLSLNSFDLESGNQSMIYVNNPNHELPGWKRISKVVQTVGLGAVGVSVTLIVNAPTSATTHYALYTAYLVAVCLGLITGMGLSIFSIVVRGSPDVGWVQERLICFTLLFVAVACILRLYFALPLANIGFGTVAVFIIVLLIVLYLWFGRRAHTTEPNSSPVVGNLPPS